MSLHTALRDRLRPFHALQLAAFLVGAGYAAVTGHVLASGVGPVELLLPIFGGLLTLGVFQFTVGSVWGYAVKYLAAGGEWRDLQFLAPFAVAAVAAVVTFAVTDDPWAAGGVGFWAFVLAAVTTTITLQFLSGYREATRRKPVE